MKYAFPPVHAMHLSMSKSCTSGKSHQKELVRCSAPWPAHEKDHRNMCRLRKGLPVSQAPALVCSGNAVPPPCPFSTRRHPCTQKFLCELMLKQVNNKNKKCPAKRRYDLRVVSRLHLGNDSTSHSISVLKPSDFQFLTA